MAIIPLLCRVRVAASCGLSSLQSLDKSSQPDPQKRHGWAKTIVKQNLPDIMKSERKNIREWDLVLEEDGSVRNIADDSTTSTGDIEVRNESHQRTYPAHYKIPDSLIENLTATDKIHRTELFALGSILYEVTTLRKPYEDRSEEDIQMFYSAGQFPNDVWALSTAPSILCCWFPEFAKHLQKSLPQRFGNYVKEHPVRFSLQCLGGASCIASVVAIPVLGAVGFTAAGPLAGSAAAGWQASIGLVEAGSLFAWCQSVAMGGAAVGGIIAAGVSGATVAAAATALQTMEDGGADMPACELKEKFQKAWLQHHGVTKPRL